RGLLERSVGWLVPLKNCAGVYSKHTIRFLKIGPVAHEPPGHRNLPPRIYSWQCMAIRELDEPITLRQKKYFSAYHQCIDPLTNKRLESRFDLAGSTCLHNDEVCAEGMCRILYSRSFSCGLGDVRWVDEDRDRSGGRHHAVHHFEAFFE